LNETIGKEFLAMKKAIKVLAFLILVSLFWVGCGPPPEITEEPPYLIVRGDDMGRTHASNLAFKKCFQEGILTCASIIVPSPWFEEAARMCLEHPEWCVGVHLTMNAEWQDYRWKPLLPMTEVSSLVDEDGYFYPTAEASLAANPLPEEVNKELRAQLELALKRKIDVQYIDTHMDTLEASPELHEVVWQIAKDYNLPLSQESGEKLLSIYEVLPDQKGKVLAEKLEQLGPGLWLLVIHPGLDTPEERALKDTNPEGLPNVAANRAAVTKALTSKRIKNIVQKRHIRLTDYRKLPVDKQVEKKP
jgi:predicted glycoside hydrolase/deacetylase ChbG (UPF0249 family)